ncbi:MAG: hypothetical protein OXG60_00685 [Chloroflexi bacterium]|nr:hypothetical protein [Chloroflexota bacterium]
MKRPRRILILLCLSLALVGTSTAQDTGQICVMSYEDHNGNRKFDENEPPVTQGIAVNLQSALGITVATKLLEASTYTVPGLVCLGDLPGGEYQVLLTSAQYRATTDAAFSAVVAPGSAPVRLDFGVTIIPVVTAEQAEDQTSQLTDEQLQGLQSIRMGLIAGMLISLVMSLIGWLIYMLVFPRRLKRIRAERLHRPPYPPAGATMGQVGMALSPAPAQTMTAPAQFQPGQGSPLLFADDDTSPNPVV